MSFAHTREHTTERIQVTQLKPTRSVPGLLDDARRGLLCTPRSLPPRYLFDAQGVRLLQALRQAPEFYLARREAELLGMHADAIVRELRPVQIVEFAAGIAHSSRMLLDACQRQSLRTRYWPVDHHRDALVQAVQGLADDYPSLPIHAVEGYCLGGLRNLPGTDGPRLFMLLGSIIGLFTPSQTQRFLIDVRGRMGPGDALLIGADRVLDATVLNAAYNDAGGTAAAFNRHLLRVLNRELSADFDPGAFTHVAYFNEALQQMEMYLTARSEQQVQINAMQQIITIRAGESIRTGVARKFTLRHLQSILTTAGYTLHKHLQGERGDYSLLLAVPRTSRLAV